MSQFKWDCFLTECCLKISKILKSLNIVNLTSNVSRFTIASVFRTIMELITITKVSSCKVIALQFSVTVVWWLLLLTSVSCTRTPYKRESMSQKWVNFMIFNTAGSLLEFSKIEWTVVDKVYSMRRMTSCLRSIRCLLWFRKMHHWLQKTQQMYNHICESRFGRIHNGSGRRKKDYYPVQNSHISHITTRINQWRKFFSNIKMYELFRSERWFIAFCM